MSRVEPDTPITNDDDPDKNKRGNTFRTVLSLFAVIAIIAGLFISQFAGSTYFIIGICLLGAGGIIFLYLTFCTNNWLIEKLEIFYCLATVAMTSPIVKTFSGMVVSTPPGRRVFGRLQARRGRAFLPRSLYFRTSAAAWTRRLPSFRAASASQVNMK